MSDHLLEFITSVILDKGCMSVLAKEYMSDEEQQNPKAHQAIGAMGNLTAQDRLKEQQVTMSSPRRRYSIGAKILFASLDAIYGKPRTLSKFKVLELVARVPYQSWEQVAYIAITHISDRISTARRIHDRVIEARQQQDNEQWHLLLLEELIADRNIKENWLLYTALPQLIAFLYYQISVIMYIIKPKWSYRLNADFEDHAEHEYMILVDENPDWETTPFVSVLAPDYGTYESLADLFRQIGYDERMHKHESEYYLMEPRFK